MNEDIIMYRKKKKKLRPIVKPKPSPLTAALKTNVLAQKNMKYKYGWLGPVLNQLGNTKRWALARHPENQAYIVGNFPLLTVYNSPQELLNACRIAVQGSAAKIFAQAPWAGVDLVQTLTGTKVFGVKVRITNSFLNFRYGAYNVRLLDGATLLGQVVVLASHIPVDIVILATNNAAGQATVVPITNPVVTFLAAENTALVTNDQIYAESLNMRDIGDIANAGAPC